MPLVLQILGHETKYWMSYFDVTMLTDERSLGINAETIHYKTIEDSRGITRVTAIYPLMFMTACGCNKNPSNNPD